MNPQDYDEDGNNIVPCPICLDVYCPSKEDGKCPKEDMFALEGEIRMLLDEYKATDDNSRIANVLEFVEKFLQAERQRVRKAIVGKGIPRVEPIKEGEVRMEETLWEQRRIGFIKARDIFLQALDNLK